MSKLFSNRYNSLYIDEDDTDDGIKPTKNISRKASKILREIELLKKKTTLTQEEKVKISKEEYWKEILYTKVKESEPNPKPNWKEIKKERKRQLEEERLKKEKEERDRIRREYEEQERIRREQERIRIEQLRLLREEDEKNIMVDIDNITIQTITNNKIENMFRILVKSGLSVEKTFKILSRKIHPDKNPKHRELATEKQKYLSQIRDKYTH